MSLRTKTSVKHTFSLNYPCLLICHYTSSLDQIFVWPLVILVYSQDVEVVVTSHDIIKNCSSSSVTCLRKPASFVHSSLCGGRVGFQLSNSVAQLEAFSMWATLSNRFMAKFLSRPLIKKTRRNCNLNNTTFYDSMMMCHKLLGMWGLLCYIFVVQDKSEIESDWQGRQNVREYSTQFHYLSFQTRILLFCLLQNIKRFN